MSLLSVFALVSILAWVVLILLRGGFWLADQRLDGQPPHLDAWPEVAVLIPARNESQTIRTAIASLMAQDYDGEYSLTVIDDNSDDATAAIAGAAAEGWDHSFSVVSGVPPLEGWTGKLWALAQGLEAAESNAPDAEYVLFTDADIEHHPKNLKRLVAKAEEGRLDLVSLMVLLRCRNIWEHLLIPAFVFFFQKLYPFPWVNNPARNEAAAAGGCMLVRRSAIKRIGGLEPIKGRIIDDVALAREIKRDGSIWLGLTETTRSLREYDTLADIWKMVTRTAAEQLNRSPAMLVFSVMGMTLIYLAPPVAAVSGWVGGDMPAMFLGAAGWLVMGFAYRPTLKLYGRPAALAAFLPLAALLYILMTVHSFVLESQGRPAAWKGRHYANQ